MGKARTQRPRYTLILSPKMYITVPFWSFYEEIDRLNIFEIPATAINTFVRLVKDIATSLNVSNCFVCGGTNLGKKWPWEAQELNYSIVLAMERQGNLTATPRKDSNWALTTNLVGSVCYARNHSTRCSQVGFVRCRSTWNNNGHWWAEDGKESSEEDRALEAVEFFKPFINRPHNTFLAWLAPDGMYWICDKFAYSQLPAGWCGACVLGIICPRFFLLPLRQRQVLGVPVYDEVGNIRS